MKNLLRCCLLSISIPLSAVLAHAQLPARENFNFLFENNYNNNVAGTYISSDFVSDWNMPGGSTPSGRVDIINDDAAHLKAMRSYYPAGTIGPTSTHGFTWYSYFSNRGQEAYFSYDIRFKSGFEWVYGGKIPGLVGGPVTSGQEPTSSTGFSARMMWKGGGSLVFYVYHHDQVSNYGDTFPWEGFQFESGKWYNLTIRVVLNTIVNGVAQSNGILEGYVNGKLFFQKTNFRFRLSSTINIEKMYLCSFFGGSTPEWQAIRDETIDFDNFVAYTYTTAANNVPAWNQPNTSGTLLHPYYSYTTTTTSSTGSAPVNPSLLNSGSVTSNSVSLTWSDNSTNENGFRVERKTGTGAYSQVAQLATNSTSFLNTGLSAGTTYSYRVYAYNSYGNSGYSNEISVTTPSSVNSTNIAAGKPSVQSSTAYNGYASRANDNNTNGVWTGGSVSNTGSALQPYWQVDLQNSYTISNIEIWNRTDACCISRLSNFYLFVSDTPFSSTDPLTTKSQSGVWSTLITDYPNPSKTLVINRSGRYIRIQVANQGELTLAEVKVTSGSTATSGTAPSAPSNLNSQVLSQTSSKIDWTDNSSNESGFRIERKTGTGAFSQIAQISSNTISWTDNTLSPGTAYTYRLCAYNTYGVSAYSNETSIQTTTQSSTVNIAPGKPSKQSSTAYGGFASRANDYNTYGLWEGNSVSNTGSAYQPYWDLDLQSSYNVSTIEIWNRTDLCCASNLKDFYVFVSDKPFNSSDPLTIVKRTEVWSSYSSVIPDPMQVISVNRSGRYIRVQLINQGELSLAEVKVFGNKLKSTDYRIADEGQDVLQLSAYPNPSYGNVNITFDLQTEARGFLGVFDITGRLLYKIADGMFSEGKNEFNWDHTQTNNTVMPGIYVIKLSAGDQTTVTKIIIDK